MNQPIDMSNFVAAKSDQLNADDLIGGPRIITVTGVKADPSSAEQPVDIHFDGDNGKPFKPCKSMRRVILNAWGKHAADYVGRSMKIYRDPSVTWGGMEVGGIRISHMTHTGGPMKLALQASNKGKKMFTVEPLNMERQNDAEAKWSEQAIKAFEGATDLDELKAIEAKRSVLMGKLATSRPELHAEITAALSICHAAFGASETATEGLADTGQYEPATDEHPATAKANQLIADAEKASTVIDLAKLVKYSAADVSAMPDDMASDVKAAFDAAEQRLKSSK